IKTVSRVFNQAPNVRPATRDNVLAAAETLNYRPNLSARQLASNRTFLVGLLYDDPDPENANDYVTVVQSGSLQACREFGYHLLINPCKAYSEGLIGEIIRLHHQVDGFIVLQPLSDLPAMNRLLRDNDIACVRVSQRPFEGFPWISVADVDAADDMTEHLLQLGHRRIGFIVGQPDHGQSHDRLAGYRRALERNGIPFEDELVEQGLFEYESGYECGRKLLSSIRPPTAIFASNDAMAMGVLSVAHEMGLDVPRELSVAGYDDSPLARHAWPALTTVRQPVAEVARLATIELVNRLQGRSDENPHHCLRAELVRRASTASPCLQASNA
ncbi:MAG: LacI family DNA-binding transcriptional regulator, partial [Gemmatimonadales bacterium]